MRTFGKSRCWTGLLGNLYTRDLLNRFREYGDSMARKETNPNE